MSGWFKICISCLPKVYTEYPKDELGFSTWHSEPISYIYTGKDNPPIIQYNSIWYRLKKYLSELCNNATFGFKCDRCKKRRLRLCEVFHMPDMKAHSPPPNLLGIAEEMEQRSGIKLTKTQREKIAKMEAAANEKWRSQFVPLESIKELVEDDE